jgi:hypothetical protein
MTQENFSIIDHCFEPPKYDPLVPDLDRMFSDKCSFQMCGRPEIEHLWTVEAYRDNEAAISNG